MLTRRRSDFEDDGRITAFTGSCCCCCCCLHWIGAAIGGAVGLRLGWTKSQAPPAGRLAEAGRGTIFQGLLLAVAALVVFGIALAAAPVRPGDNSILIAIVFVPSLVFVLFGAVLVARAGLAQRSARAALRRRLTAQPPTIQTLLSGPPKTLRAVPAMSIFCTQCWHDLGPELERIPASCPSCAAAVDWATILGPDHGVGVAWKMAWMGFAWSTLLSGAAYLVMLALFR